MTHIPTGGISDVGLNAWLPKGAHVDGSFWQLATPAVSTLLNLPEQYYGQDAEDQYAQENFFSGLQSPGTYLELGAHDGMTISNTLYFAQRGWKGLLIEPNIHSYRSLVMNRPGDVCVNAAICSNSTQVHFVEAEVVGGVYEFMAPDFVAKWHPNVTVEDLPVIACTPLGTVLAKAGLHKVNFFSLDVENAELDVLKTLDFKQVSFDVIVVEADGGSASKYEEVKQLLLDNHYQYHGHVTRNDWFVHTSFVNSSPV